MTRIALFLALSLTLASTAHATGKPVKTSKASKASKASKSDKADKAQAPVVLDMSAPDAPSSEFPDVVNKGSL
jgi:hypothetical protein